MSVLVVLQFSKPFIIVFWNVHVLYTYFGMLNSKINISKTRIDANDASIILNQYLITFLIKLILTSIIDNVGFRNKHFKKPALMPSMPQLVVTTT